MKALDGALVVIGGLLLAAPAAAQVAGSGPGLAEGNAETRTTNANTTLAPKEVYDHVSTTRPSPTQTHVRTRPATLDEITVGSVVNDTKGQAVGTITSIEPNGAILTTSTTKVKLPLDAIGTDGKHLLIGMTKAEFDTQVAKATTTPAG